MAHLSLASIHGRILRIFILILLSSFFLKRLLSGERGIIFYIALPVEAHHRCVNSAETDLSTLFSCAGCSCCELYFFGVKNPA